MEIWRGRVLWRVYVHPHTHPHTQLKKSGIPHTHIHTQSMRGFPIKTGTGSGNTHGDGFICHLYVQKADCEINFVKTENQLANLFKKPLAHDTFNKPRIELVILDMKNVI